MTLDLMHADAVKTHHPNDTPVRFRDLGRHREHHHRAGRLPRQVPRRARHQAPGDHPSRNRAPGVREGRASLRHRDGPCSRRSGDDAGRPRFRALAHQREHGGSSASAGNYPYGTIDPIADLSALALERDIGLHVDGCLGGFILPWGQELGYDIPVFDFRLPGVTSISADTHKYGYGLKGTSVVMYRDRAFRKYQYFLSPEWPGGKYFSPGLAGSRSGGLLAATWASMVSLGREGYRRYAKAIFGPPSPCRRRSAAVPSCA